MTNPMNPNSRTIEAGDPAKVRRLMMIRRDTAETLGYGHAMDSAEIPHSAQMLIPGYLTGYLLGCDARRGIVR